MILKEYTVTVQDENGDTVQVFGNNVPPTDEDIERCIKACNLKGGMYAFVDTTYSLERRINE